MEHQRGEAFVSLEDQDMPFPALDKIRFNFLTQQPRDDGCGLVVVQMLTGLPYGEIAALVDWGGRTNHYLSWETVRDLLEKLDLKLDDSRRAQRWSEIRGLAFVHVEPDHYILYDADNAVFYDPGQATGPDTETSLIPMAYYPVRSPLIGKGG